MIYIEILLKKYYITIYIVKIEKSKLHFEYNYIIQKSMMQVKYKMD